MYPNRIDSHLHMQPLKMSLRIPKYISDINTPPPHTRKTCIHHGRGFQLYVHMRGADGDVKSPRQMWLALWQAKRSMAALSGGEMNCSQPPPGLITLFQSLESHLSHNILPTGFPAFYSVLLTMTSTKQLILNLAC